jgi:hypothetical protein
VEKGSAMGILDLWELTIGELDEIVAASPSLRGFMFGYVSEYKLRKMWFSGDSINNLVKYDNHDRTRKSDMAFTYKGVEISVEAKSLQSGSIRKVGETYTGKFQCDASDRRQVSLPSGETIETTCLLVDEFDLVAVNIFDFERKWRFAFAKNRDLPRSQYKKYTPEQQEHLLATLITITWPLQPPFMDEPFHLLDEIAEEKRRGGPRGLNLTRAKRVGGLSR